MLPIRAANINKLKIQKMLSNPADRYNIPKISAEILINNTDQ